MHFVSDLEKLLVENHELCDRHFISGFSYNVKLSKIVYFAFPDIKE